MKKVENEKNNAEILEILTSVIEQQSRLLEATKLLGEEVKRLAKLIEEE